MPEVSIGLYPDVGGSWFLRRMRTSGDTIILFSFRLTASPGSTS